MWTAGHPQLVRGQLLGVMTRVSSINTRVPGAVMVHIHNPHPPCQHAQDPSSTNGRLGRGCLRSWPPRPWWRWSHCWRPQPPLNLYLWRQPRGGRSAGGGTTDVSAVSVPPLPAPLSPHLQPLFRWFLKDSNLVLHTTIRTAIVAIKEIDLFWNKFETFAINILVFYFYDNAL